METKNVSVMIEEENIESPVSLERKNLFMLRLKSW